MQVEGEGSGEGAAEVQADGMQNQVHWCCPFELFILKKVTDHTYDAAAQVAKRGRKRGLQIDEREMCDYEKVIPITCNSALVLI